MTQEPFEGSSSRASEQYRILRERIMSGDLEPGTRLFETTLSAELGVSRTPIREALGQLEYEGFVERETRGYQVRVGRPQEILDIHEVRILLESGAAGIAAVRRSDLELAQLVDAHETSSALSFDDHEAVTRTSQDFHEILRSATHNQILSNLIRTIDVQVRLLDRLPISVAQAHAHEQTLHEHEAIVTAIRDQDAESATRSMTTHLTRTRDLRIKFLAKRTA